MARDVELQCRCGQVHGWLRGASPGAANRVVCYCDDCQAYLHHLGRAELLDEHGGSDIVQVAPATLEYDRGREQIEGVRLTAKGLYRWYARCCRTPLGNTVTPTVPFVGVVVAGLMRAPADEVLGAPQGRVFGKYAVGEAPPGSQRPSPRLLLRMLGKMLAWKLRGRTWPHPFFDRARREPTYPVTVLPPAEREALRARCGPRPADA